MQNDVKNHDSSLVDSMGIERLHSLPFKRVYPPRFSQALLGIFVYVGLMDKPEGNPSPRGLHGKCKLLGPEILLGAVDLMPRIFF